MPPTAIPPPSNNFVATHRRETPIAGIIAVTSGVIGLSISRFVLPAASIAGAVGHM
jgi:hypothetical protein